jgi:glycosyltransferase A (GT-A) superfamily protein (DUF2064 family)
MQARDALDYSELVLGPAIDGGYVLIGARMVLPEIFHGITWGTASVLAETRRALLATGVTWAELPTLADIDRPDDLALWEQVRAP